MKSRVVLLTLAVALLATIVVVGQSKGKHFNPDVDLLNSHAVQIGVSYVASRGAAPPANFKFDPPAPPMPTVGAQDVCGFTPMPADGEGPPRGAAPAGGNAGRGAAPGGAAGGRGGDAAAAGRGGAPGGGNAGRGGGGRGGDPNAAPPAPVSYADAAKQSLAYKNVDFLFGSMEGGIENPMPAFSELMKAMGESGLMQKTPYAHLSHPTIIKTPKIRDVAKTSWNISQQLNTGVAGLMFVGVECSKEVQIGLNAMRLKSKGGTRLDNVGMAPQVWGLSEKEYREKADVWGLNPNGELVNWTIVESKRGLENVRDIAKTKGIGVLWPGAGTLGGVFSITKTDGSRGRDDWAWENSIQQVLAACKEFNVSCGYPVGAQERNADGTTNPGYIEYRRKQGFNVLLFQGVNDEVWKVIDLTRKNIAGSPSTSK